MKHERTITVPREEAAVIRRYLRREPQSEAECMGEDTIITHTAVFDDGFEVDVKCCGVQYQEGVSNRPWTEAVLFHHGYEITFTEPEEDYFGTWTLWHGNDAYVVTVAEDGR